MQTADFEWKCPGRHHISRRISCADAVVLPHLAPPDHSGAANWHQPGEREFGSQGHAARLGRRSASASEADELALQHRPGAQNDVRPRTRAASEAVAPTLPAANKKPPTSAGFSLPGLAIFRDTQAWIVGYFTRDKVQRRSPGHRARPPDCDKVDVLQVRGNRCHLTVCFHPDCASAIEGQTYPSDLNAVDKPYGNGSASVGGCSADRTDAISMQSDCCSAVKTRAGSRQRN
jgi:hypothetical protein